MLVGSLPFVQHTRKLFVGQKQIGAKFFDEHVDVTFIPDRDNRFKLSFPFNRVMLNEIKSMSHHKWHGNDGGPGMGPKLWSVRNDARTAFVVNYLDIAQPDPYSWYKKPIIPAPIWRKNLYGAQVDMINFAWTKHYCEWACEMGLGKSLSAIHTIELGYEHTTNPGDVYWVGPKSALAAVVYEFEVWDCPIKTYFMTYEGMTKLMKNWQPGQKAPQFVIYDESSRVKNMEAQRTEAALHLANAVRGEWGTEGFVINMTGTPAPKAPVDWYSQIEIVQPGFLKEGSMRKFRERLSVCEKKDYGNGYSTDKILAWLDNEDKCRHCGKMADDIEHGFDHKFVKSVNEVEKLRVRLKPIVLVKMKKDCLDLPDRRYEVINFPMSNETKRFRDMLKKRASSMMLALSLCRELSDGFIYEQVPDGGSKACPVCKGTKKELVHIKDKEEVEYDMVECPICFGRDGDCPVCSGEGFIKNAPNAQQPAEYTFEMKPCRHCKATGSIPTLTRTTKEIGTPKDDAFRALLDMHEEYGRFVAYGGFTGTIDRMVKIALRAGWDVMRCDGRGLTGIRCDAMRWDYGDLVPAFQRKDSPVKKLCFIGHPEAGGMGLNLTRACGLAFYSNSFKADARDQAEARIHRIGMDENLGATIYDLVHLPEDSAVLKILKANRDLQAMSMVEFEKVVSEVKEQVNTPWILKPV